MTKADQAYEATQTEIARVMPVDETTLDLSGEVFRDLNRLPQEVAELTALQALGPITTRTT